MTDESITIKKATFNKLLVGLVVVLIAFSFTAGFMLGGGKLSGTATQTGNEVQQQPTQQPTEPSRVQVSADGDPQIGDDNAKVTIIEFSDFQCPYCGRFYEQSEKQIITDYVDTGKVKFVYRDFPLDSIHPNARPAANAAECVNEQGKFWEFHDKLFSNQDALSTDNYKKWASELGLDMTRFNSCLNSSKYDSEITKDFQDGAAAGVQGTPTIYIGSPEKGYIQIVGAQPYSVVKQAIEQELAA